MWAAHSPRAGENDARLIEWTVLVPSAQDVSEVGESLQRAGYETAAMEGGVTVTNPWGTGVRITTRA